MMSVLLALARSSHWERFAFRIIWRWKVYYFKKLKMESSVEFEQSYCWKLVKDYLGEEDQRSFEAVFVKYKFYKDFDPLAQLLVEPVPPDSDIKWESLLTKAFSKVQSTLKNLGDSVEKAPIEVVFNTLVGIMEMSFLESYADVIPDPRAFIAKAIEKARAIHNTTTFSVPAQSTEQKVNEQALKVTGVKICEIKDAKKLEAIETDDSLWDLLLDVIPSRDVLFEQIKNGNWKELIVCRKTRQYAVAAFFDLCKLHDILIVRFKELSLVLVDEERKILNTRVEQLCEKGRNGRYATAEMDYKQVEALFVAIRDKSK